MIIYLMIIYLMIKDFESKIFKCTSDEEIIWLYINLIFFSCSKIKYEIIMCLIFIERRIGI